MKPRDIRIHKMIRKAICYYFNLRFDDIDKPTRKRTICEPRQIEHCMMKEYTGASLKEIGTLSGGKDHATVLNSEKTINNLIDTDKIFYKKYKIIQELFKDIKFDELNNIFLNLKVISEKGINKREIVGNKMKEVSEYVDNELLSIIG